MSLLFNTLSLFVIAFLPRSKPLLISWLQSPYAAILGPKNIKSVTVSIVSPSICHEVMGPDAMIFLNFEHYFASMWDECNCTVLGTGDGQGGLVIHGDTKSQTRLNNWTELNWTGTFFGIACLWNWNENGPFPVLWPLLNFQICWCIELSTFTASFRVWNISAGIP